MVVFFCEMSVSFLTRETSGKSNSRMGDLFDHTRAERGGWPPNTEMTNDKADCAQPSDREIRRLFLNLIKDAMEWLVSTRKVGA